MSSDLLSVPIVKLLDSERFYAEIILGMNISISRKVPTAGVWITDKVNLAVNPDYFSKLSVDQQIAVLKHECAHILNDHIPRSKELAPDVYKNTKDLSDEDKIIHKMQHKSLNIAADCSINTGIKHIPEESVFPKTFNLEENQTMEWYHEHLKNNPEADGFMKFDDHALWGDSDGDKERLREKIRQHINDAATKAKAAGSMTSDDELLVSRLNFKAKDWKADLRRFAAKQINNLTDSSKKKRNRRYGVSYPGIVRSEELVLGVAIDTSGSVSDAALCQFMAEIAKIAQYAKIIIVEADTEVKNRYEFDPKKTYTVKGRGGTAYQPAFDWFNKNEEIDGLIYFGDMDCYDETITKPKYPVLWAIVGDQKPPAEWGSSTQIIIVEKRM